MIKEKIEEIDREYTYEIKKDKLFFLLHEKKISIFKEFKKIKNKNNLFTCIMNYNFQLFDGETPQIQETNNNHIIPCNYFYQWVKSCNYNKLSKNKKLRQNKIETSKSNNSVLLENFMKIDGAFMDSLEKLFTKGGSENCSFRDNLQKLIEEKTINDIEFVLFREFETYTSENDTFYNYNLASIKYDDIEEQKFTESYQSYRKRKSDLNKFLNFINKDSFLNLYFYFKVFQQRQNIWNILKKDSLKNIITLIIKDYNKTKSFNNYKFFIYGISKILKEEMFKSKKISIYGCDLNDGENILYFLKEFLKYIQKNKISKEFQKRLNTLFFTDLINKIKRSNSYIYIFSTEKKLNLANLPIFESKSLGINFFPLSPNILLLEGHKTLIQLILHLSRQEIIEAYEKELHNRKDCEIIKLD